MRLIREAGTTEAASIIDIGGGASPLVDDLLDHGYRDITVLDLSGHAIEAAKARLGDRSGQVNWREDDVLRVRFPAGVFDVWHDRAVFHFLTDDRDRRAYVDTVLHSVKPGGLVIVATFAEDGPTRCSGLPVARYSADELHSQFGRAFQLLGHEKESHITPGGNEQKFVYCFCRLVES